MKKTLLVLMFCQLAMSIDCKPKLENIINQLQHAKLNKQPNVAKINYLNYRYENIKNACTNNQIELNDLRTIEFDAKIIYEKEKLKIDEKKLQEAYEKLNKRRIKLDEQAAKLQERREMLKDY